MLQGHSKIGKRKRVVAVTMMLLVSVSLPCIAAELFLRWLEPPPNTPELFVKAANPEIGALGKPGASGMFSGAQVKFNSLGLRDREFTMQRAADVSRIVMLGDSITFGLGVAQDSAYPRVTEDLLNRALRPQQRSVEVLNFGIPGYNTVNELAQFRELGLQYDPDLVVVGFLYNDVAQASGPKPSAPTEQGLRATINRYLKLLKQHSLLFARISRALGDVVRKFVGQGFGQVGSFKYRYVDDDLDWLRVRSALLELGELGVENGFDVAVMIIPAMANVTEDAYPLSEYHQAVSEFCAANNIPYLDLLPAFWGMDARKFWISATDGHPNAQGHRIIADALGTFLLERKLGF